jgi:hypothetical protein
MSLFKKHTREGEITDYVKGLTASTIGYDFTPKEIIEIHARVTVNLVSHLERIKGELLIASKKAKENYKAASCSLNTLKNS